MMTTTATRLLVLLDRTRPTRRGLGLRDGFIHARLPRPGRVVRRGTDALCEDLAMASLLKSSRMRGGRTAAVHAPSVGSSDAYAYDFVLSAVDSPVSRSGAAHVCPLKASSTASTCTLLAYGRCLPTCTAVHLPVAGWVSCSSHQGCSGGVHGIIVMSAM